MLALIYIILLLVVLAVVYFSTFGIIKFFKSSFGGGIFGGFFSFIAGIVCTALSLSSIVVLICVIISICGRLLN